MDEMTNFEIKIGVPKKPSFKPKGGFQPLSANS